MRDVIHVDTSKLPRTILDSPGIRHKIKDYERKDRLHDEVYDAGIYFCKSAWSHSHVKLR